ncbi:MAG: hypothetical protein A2Y03_08195 [Omnitrophica WOR_2 bacterium GWF2_38_59]|nr:MAG: hypothetical protein A2Y06_07090 [Omnitrophica WOR_2 bacterium GWA2_37_7]OGX25473.1 MAG: hypothetical protein A2Y03_08195 [Omnitrophica WOR_2 bacterium GWF2_38_59]OGX48135.1 MAG: hypothetical protein A2243_02980 [Omnitrophica WOR_2 bacterium RIFOXYA2_FULL_38_17]OGX56415.1 MAG: hypothetical protein A2447_10470 [Omnitrophica WOR_2 bacterium RIFOXYC2_FULL_38_12]OGX58471.1 MAG: hypothetical protein A2306_11320 [Omnitrophica WOR_2 bacterium RIFOXYB2_FULL_38_16]HBG62537.1 hypothetical protei
MVEFDLWREAFVFACVYAVIIIVPCIIVALLGNKMIGDLGRYPTKTPAIQMSIVWKLIVTEIITFVLLIMFYNVFHH